MIIRENLRDYEDIPAPVPINLPRIPHEVTRIESEAPRWEASV
jgi:hypothetical protein